MSETPARPTFGELLAELRQAAQLSRAELSRRAELSPRSIRNLESGAYRPYGQTVRRLALALDLGEADRARLEQAGSPAERQARSTPRDVPSGSAATAAPDGEAAPTHNLPVPLTSFIGRQQEQRAIDDLLGAARLVTLTGAGGIGKTRLALEVAANRVGAYPDGVWLVELAGVSDDRLVPEAVGGVLVRHEQGRRAALDWLADGLRGRHLLLVLDNCEHLVAACAALADHLLRACPNVRLLTTSREALGIVGEHIWRVPPLHLPANETRVSRLHDEPAVRLFVERAQATSARFRLTAENASAVVEICRRLDGVPLAIELAAGWIGVLTAPEVAARLGDRFRLLAAGGRGTPARHQTLRAVVAWSYDLASEPARRLFERLAPFAGGWTLEAAEAVAGAGPDVGDGSWVLGLGDDGSVSPSPKTQHPRPDTLDLLGQLVDQSLVSTEEEGGQTRYRFLDTLREYAVERLAGRGETEAVHRRHAEYFLALAEAADLGLRGPEQARWASRLAREHDNLQAALRWSTDHGEAELAHRLVGALWTYWYTRPRGAEGARWCEPVLALGSESVPPAIRGRALTSATGQAMLEGNLARARARSQASLALFDTLEDSEDRARALLLGGLLQAIVGEVASARGVLQDALTMLRRLGDRRQEGWALSFLGQVATFAGDYEQAGALLADSRRLLREVEDAFGLAQSLMKSGDVACHQGDLQEARAHYEESLIQFRAAGAPLGRPILLHNLACILRQQGEPGRAAPLFQDGVRLFRDRGDEPSIARCLLGLVDLALDARQPGLAARLLGVADRLPPGRPYGLLGGWVWTGGRRSLEEQMALARAELGDAAFEATFAEGQTQTPEQAAAEASILVDALTPPPRVGRSQTSA